MFYKIIILFLLILNYLVSSEELSSSSSSLSSKEISSFSKEIDSSSNSFVSPKELSSNEEFSSSSKLFDSSSNYIYENPSPTVNGVESLSEMYEKCIFNDSNYYYDLSKLIGVSLNITEKRGETFSYYFSICSKNNYCNYINDENNVQSCQIISTSEKFIMGKIDRVGTPSLNENEIILKYNDDTDYRNINIQFLCEHGVEHHLDNFEESQRCTYNFKIKTKYACLPNSKVNSPFICESINENGLKIKNRDNPLTCNSNGQITCFNDDDSNCLIDNFKVICNNQTEYITCFGDNLSCEYNSYKCSIKSFKLNDSNNNNNNNTNLNNSIPEFNYKIDQLNFNSSNSIFNLNLKNLLILLILITLLN
ncbi:hypothetical protein RB653_007866 [Dictyostelium firmibasis]|uniref:MRH domain-containing protein n=1 Tax=Dictyostelium firmibasis TaxID=79012 RepID=A0AAN7TMI1_9MYCE